MKKNLSIYICGLVASLMVSSCQMKSEIMDKVEESATGQWTLSVNAEDTSSPIQVLSKGSEPECDVNNFQVDILKDSKPCQSFSHYSDLIEAGSLILEQGSYQVLVSSGDMLEAAFNKPVFSGQKSFTILPRTITRTDVVCQLQNVKVSVDYSDNFLRSFKPDFAVNVTNGKGVLIYSKDTVGIGYFKPSNVLKLTIVATTTDGMKQITQTFYLNEQKNNGIAEAKDYFKVYLDIKDQIGMAAKPMIVADLTLNERTEDVLLPTEPESEPPTDTDPSLSDGPKLTPTGFSFGVPILFAQADEPKPTVIVDIDATEGEGIEHLIVDIESDYLTSLLPFNVPIDLAHLSETDAAMINELGLPTDVLGKETVRFDISQFMGPLAIGVGTTTFTLTVSDKKGNTSKGAIITTVTE